MLTMPMCSVLSHILSFSSQSCWVSVHSQQHFFPPSHPYNVVLSGTFVSVFRFFPRFTIYLALPDHFITQIIIAFLSSICIFKINLYLMVYCWTRSHSFIVPRKCGSTVLLLTKKSGREVQPLAPLYPTVRLSPWR